MKRNARVFVPIAIDLKNEKVNFIKQIHQKIIYRNQQRVW